MYNILADGLEYSLRNKDQVAGLQHQVILRPAATTDRGKINDENLRTAFQAATGHPYGRIFGTGIQPPRLLDGRADREVLRRRDIYPAGRPHPPEDHD